MIRERIVRTTATPIRSGPVLYWMDRDMRLSHNWALIHAQSLAKDSGEPLLIAYNLVQNFLGGGSRQLAFKLKALKELSTRCEELRIPFYIVTDDTGSESPRLLLDFVEEHQVGAVVTDFSPLHIQRSWKEELAEKLPVQLIEVDAHNIVPVTVASPKLEFGAYTLRPKLHRLLPTYLDAFPEISEQSVPYSGPAPSIDWEKLEERITEELTWILPGEQEAQKALETFLTSILPSYALKRNDALAHGQSNLSPYLHYGMLSAQHVAMSVLAYVDAPVQDVMEARKNKAVVDESHPLGLIDHASAFLEELIVRRELSDNFCFYNTKYGKVEGFPAWALKSHATHRNDPREHIYDQETFEEAKTHDELWNAAQREMTTTGKMHGYMRMYWAKKILEWTASPEEAMAIAIYLNDKYELDGRDPNGYAGIAWSIGGTHDRAWFTRPVYGQIRYMARSGSDKKFNTKAYIEKFS